MLKIYFARQFWRFKKCDDIKARLQESAIISAAWAICDALRDLEPFVQF